MIFEVERLMTKVVQTEDEEWADMMVTMALVVPLSCMFLVDILGEQYTAQILHAASFFCVCCAFKFE